MATIKAVAAKAGVSVTTVSRTLNNRGYISQEMREKIAKAMEELNYHPNEVARSLTKRCTRIIGVLVPSINSPFFAEVVSELSFAISRHGYKMMLYSSIEADDQASEYISMLKASQVDGMILGLRGRAIEAELNDDLPVVSFERLRVGNLPTILCDNEEGGRMAARELLNCGCKRPMMVSTFCSHDIPAYNRMKGFLSVLRENGLEERVVEDQDRDHDSQAFYPPLAKSALERYPDTDGIFCSSDLLACYMQRELLHQKKSIPGDVQLIGFNSNAFANYLCPALTSVRQPIPEMCEKAVQCLIKQISGKRVSADMVFPVTLERRESTKAPMVSEGGIRHEP